MTIRNPIEWGWDQMRLAGHAAGGRHIDGTATRPLTEPLLVRRIAATDLKDALAKGLEDFAACRTDAMYVCVIFALTLGPGPPASLSSFVADVFGTGAGWAMIVVGIGAGFLFACLAFAISVVSFPLMLDRDAALRAAIGTSLRAIAENPGPMALWGFIVAAGLVLGSIPVLLGLIVVLPVLGHATWHLYRKVVS